MSQKWVVIKFGGTSVTGRQNWGSIQKIINRRRSEGFRVFIVCSALSKISDALEALAQKAARNEAWDEELASIEERHRSQAQELGVSLDCVSDFLGDLQRLSKGASLIQEVSDKLWARILSAGELMSTRLGVQWLQQQGCDAQWLDAREV